MISSFFFFFFFRPRNNYFDFEKVWRYSRVFLDGRILKKKLIRFYCFYRRVERLAAHRFFIVRNNNFSR